MKFLFFLPFFVLASIVESDTQKRHKSFHEDFKKAKSRHFRYGSTGTAADFKYKMGMQSPTEPGTNILSFKLNPEEEAGPGKGPEIISKKFTHFGSYSTRLKIPAVRDRQPDVGAVVGCFTYHEDDKEGLSEIDFEWLVADPRIIYVGTWTGEHGKLQRIGRIINLAEGKILETVSKINYDGTPTALEGLQNLPETIPAIKNYDASSRFYTYGFDWGRDRLRWWMLHPETADTVVLWDYQGSRLGIPQHASKYRMNFWHTQDWAVEGNPNSMEKPAFPFELEVDWMEYMPR
ncbi:glycoside hydrolase family 16 protein [Algoriphagus sp. AGSA1]|uniref:glycoside hydrolase family 16 protein n=1 Tax=Algoriphagus sp. AGSA1 TaxID=2907213 RepID=UPI001F4238FF|nr:glycoside hydrolase family 16 protein [Algoriphagus sp. AGSA1]MCE7055150.1 glycoside hydrolase family 16 protein [Algoriphagus sp. AGSA1]